MQNYKNLNTTSGIKSFEIADNSITVQFKDDTTYRYTNENAGHQAVETMKNLAVEGVGLNAYICTEKPAYDKVA